MSFYTNMASLAERMVEKFTLGDVTIRNQINESYDTANGQTTRIYATKTVPYAPAMQNERKEQNWAQIYIGIYVAGNDLEDFVPVVDSIVTMPNGDSHKIKEIVPYPNNVAFNLYLAKDVCQV